MGMVGEIGGVDLDLEPPAHLKSLAQAAGGRKSGTKTE